MNISLARIFKDAVDNIEASTERDDAFHHNKEIKDGVDVLNQGRLVKIVVGTLVS